MHFVDSTTNMFAPLLDLPDVGIGGMRQQMAFAAVRDAP